MILTEDLVFTAIGVLGAGLVLFGFYRISIGRWTHKTLWYELDNVLGPMCMIIYSYHHEAYISIIINIIWISVTFRGLIPFAERYGKRLRKTVKAKARAKASARAKARRQASYRQHHT